MRSGLGKWASGASGNTTIANRESDLLYYQKLLGQVRNGKRCEIMTANDQLGKPAERNEPVRLDATRAEGLDCC